MVDYANFAQSGVSILLTMIIGYVAFKFNYLKVKSINPTNLFLLKCCYFPMIFRNIAIRDIKNMSVMPFVIGICSNITTHLLMTVIFLLPIKNKLYWYLSSVFSSVYVNYLILGFPIFNAIWDENENITVSIMALSNDLINIPIFLTLANIYNIKKEREMRQQGSDGQNDSTTSKESLQNSCSINEITEETDYMESSIEEGFEKEIQEEEKRDYLSQEISSKSSADGESMHSFEIPVDHESKNSTNVAEKDNQSMFSCRFFGEIAKRVLTNPFVLGIIIGFIWGLIGLNLCNYVETLTRTLGSSVLALCLLCVGGFLSQHSIISCGYIQFIGCVLVRHILFPLVVCCYSLAFGIPPRLARQCIILSCLPTATGAYPVSAGVGVGEGVASTMIFWTSIVCVPFQMLWLYVLDKAEFFVD